MHMPSGHRLEVAGCGFNSVGSLPPIATNNSHDNCSAAEYWDGSLHLLFEVLISSNDLVVLILASWFNCYSSLMTHKSLEW